MNYLGDFAEDATVYIPFNTFSSDDPSASVTITDLADADIKVHKDGGTTEIATDGATIAINFDSITGNHLITIDTSAHSDYAIGSDYMVRIEGTTVDAATINAWVGSFSIENRFIRVDEIAANAITATAINADAITSAKIADNALSNEHFASGALTDAECAADVTKISGDAAAADTLEASCDTIYTCVVAASGSSTTAITTETITEPTADHFNGGQIRFVTGDLAGQQREVTDYSFSVDTATFTVATMTDTPGSGDIFILF